MTTKIELPLNAIALAYAFLSLQLTLYSATWQIIRRLAPQTHAASGDAARFSGFLAIAMALFALREQVPPWVGQTGSNIALLWAFAYLPRGVHRLFDMPVPPRRHLIECVLLSALLVLLGPSPEHVSLRLTALSLPCAWWCWKTVTGVRQRIGAEFGRAASVTCIVLGCIAIGAWSARAAQAWLTPIDALELISPTGSNLLRLIFFWLLTTIAEAWMFFLLAVRRARQLKNQAQRDHLTNVLNRNGFDAALTKEWSHFERNATQIAALALDIDHFKRVNDQHGHPTGDAVLNAVARALAGTLRDIDVLGRVGGEEFVVLLPGCSVTTAEVVAERLRKEVQATRVPVGRGTLNVTISIGLSCTTIAGQSASALLKSADQALYAAKGDGRNRVVVAQKPEEPCQTQSTVGIERR